MKHISELANILNNYLNWNKARVTCLAQMLRSIIAVKTVNLTQIASCFYSNVKIDSSYKRIQRFLRFFDFDLSVIVKIVMALFPMPKKIILIIDRTNWTWGKSHLNLLVLSVAYHGMSIPVFWYNLKRAGNSQTQDRILIVSKILDYIGKDKIKYLLADREFVGNQWFDWLISTGVNFIIRIKHDTMVGREKKCKYKTPVSFLFKYLKKNKYKDLKKRYWLDKHEVFLSASRSSKGELLILVTPKFTRKTVEIYQIRWEIETLFGCLKSKGFCLEETRLIKEQRLEKLFFIVTLAFIWAYQAGMFRSINKPIKIKKHERKSYCLFRYGLEVLRNSIINNLQVRFFLLLLIDTKTLKLRSCSCI